MQLPASRSIVVISGLLTLLVLGGGTIAVGFHNGWLRTASDAPARDTVATAPPTHSSNDRQPVVAITQPLPAAPAQGGTAEEIGVYRQKLEEAYRALDDAYAQIRALQSAQLQLAAARDDDDDFAKRDRDDDRRGGRFERRRSHDD